jgi:acyl-CoA thioesterase
MSTADSGVDGAPLPPSDLLESMGFVRLVHADPVAGTALAEFDALPRFCHTEGTIVQGGFVTAWLDFTMIRAAMVRLGHPAGFASLELKVSFLQRVGPGRVVAQGRVQRLGRRVGFLEGTLSSPDGAVLATASSTVMVMPPAGTRSDP